MNFILSLLVRANIYSKTAGEDFEQNEETELMEADQ